MAVTFDGILKDTWYYKKSYLKSHIIGHIIKAVQKNDYIFSLEVIICQM